MHATSSIRQKRRPASSSHQTVTPSPPTWPLTRQNILCDHVNSWPCPLCVRTLRAYYGAAHGRIRTPSVSALLTSEDSRPPDRPSRACRPRRPISKLDRRRDHTVGPPGSPWPPAGLETSGSAE